MILCMCVCMWWCSNGTCLFPQVYKIIHCYFRWTASNRRAQDQDGGAAQKVESHSLDKNSDFTMTRPNPHWSLNKILEGLNWTNTEIATIRKRAETGRIILCLGLVGWVRFMSGLGSADYSQVFTCRWELLMCETTPQDLTLTQELLTEQWRWLREQQSSKHPPHSILK